MGELLMLHWCALFAAAAFEIGWVAGFKMIGWERPVISVATIASLVLSLTLLWFAVQQVPISIAYGVWTGLGAVGAVLVGHFLYQESLTIAKLFFASLILAGIVGLKSVSTA
jgi:quaternary ammonium compound-resistance protein SugE